VTYRNQWGTPGTYALVFDPDEKLPYEPASFIFDESRCFIENNVMTLNTNEGIKNLVTYAFYPAQSPESTAEINATLKLDYADKNGCNISAGCWIRIEPDKVSLADRPSVNFALDATQWHDYRIIRSGGKIKVYVDGTLKLDASSEGLEVRNVQVGNRQVKGMNFNKIDDGEADMGWFTSSTSHWKKLSVKVDNVKDYSIDWKWDANKGFPDQFRRDRIVVLDRIAATFGHCGYSGWTQMEDGTIVIADYTVGGNGGQPANMPFIRAYVTNEEELTK